MSRYRLPSSLGLGQILPSQRRVAVEMGRHREPYIDFGVIGSPGDQITPNVGGGAVVAPHLVQRSQEEPRSVKILVQSERRPESCFHDVVCSILHQALRETQVRARQAWIEQDRVAIEPRSLHPQVSDRQFFLGLLAACDGPLTIGPCGSTGFDGAIGDGQAIEGGRPLFPDLDLGGRQSSR